MNKSYFNTEWIGEYPSNWKLVGMTKYIDTLVDYRGKTPKKTDGGIFLVTAKNIKNGKIDYKISKEYIAIDDYVKVMSRGLPKISDVLFTTEAPLGEVANVDKEDIALAQRVIKFRGKKDILDNYFLKYWMLSKGFNQNLLSLATGSTALGIKASKLYNLRLLLPPINIQRLIVDYLNKKIMDVDILTGIKEKQIKLLEEQRQAMIKEAVTKGLNLNVKMKDSGVKFIGELPEHWKTTKVKRYTKITSGGTPDKNKEDYWENGNINWVSSGEVNKKIIYDSNKKITLLGLQKSSTKMLPRNSVLMALNGQGKTKGTVAILKIEACVNQSLGAFITNEKNLNYKYLYYFFESKYRAIRGLVGDGLRDGLSLQTIGNLYIPLPDISEQKKIVDMLDSNLNIYDSILDKISYQISRIKEYRQSLIHEAVTGKIPIEEMESYLKEAEKDGN